MERFLLVFLISFLQIYLFAQPKSTLQGPFGGEFVIEKTACLSPQERAQIHAQLRSNIQDLQARGILPTAYPKSLVTLKWPVRQAAGFDYNSYYGISNYFDHDEDYSGSNNSHVLDYNCGSRSYDTGSGYNHQGTDIFTWPFGWHMLLKNQVEVVAAAAGTIIAKFDGNFDRQCTFNSNPWNAVYVQHEDGSIAWYGHVKTGSLTDKAIGEQVEQGEYLAVVASSGNSTGPHLHFEVYDENGQLIDPYSGECNELNEDSWWQEQKPYIEPTINTIATGWAAPQFFYDCPQVIPANPNFSNCFAPGDEVVFSAYYHDQVPELSSHYAIYDPNGEELTSWQHSSNIHYTASYWFWTETIPADAMLGEWQFEVTLAGDTVTHPFLIAEEGVFARVAPAEDALNGCEDEGVALTALGGTQYFWSTGETTATINVLTSGTYYVTVLNNLGCEAEASKTVTVNPVPVTSAITGNDDPDAFDTNFYVVTGTSGSTYTWTVTGGTQISGDDSNLITVEWGEGPTGQVCVTETNAGGCSGEQVCKDITIIPVTSTRRIRQLERIDIFPNPVREQLNFRIRFDEVVQEVEVQLLSVMGQSTDRFQVQPEATTDLQGHFDVSNLPAGIYWLEVKVQGERLLEKVVLF